MSYQETNQGLFRATMFFIQHEVSPALGDRAAAVIVANEAKIKEMLQQRLFSQEDLSAAIVDPKNQQDYLRIMHAARSGGVQSEQASLELKGYTTVKLAAWFRYYRAYHEKTWGLKLFSEE